MPSTGQLAQDVEEWVLLQALGKPSPRLDVFGDADVIGVQDYLKGRDLPFARPQTMDPQPSSKRWWEFWK